MPNKEEVSNFLEELLDFNLKLEQMLWDFARKNGILVNIPELVRKWVFSSQGCIYHLFKATKTLMQ